MLPVNKKFLFYKIGYVFFPFFSFLLSLIYYKSSWFKNALWLFIIYYGFSLSFLETIDAFDYKEGFEEIVRKSANSISFFDIIDPVETGTIDFLVPSINYLLSLFTSNYHFLFGFYGFIFGYFYSRNFDFIISQIPRNYSAKVTVLILFAACYIGFWNINGFRFWVATHIFTYGLINFIFLNKRVKGLFFLVSPLIVHFSFALPLAVFILYRLVPTYSKLFLVFIFILSYYNPFNDLTLIKKYIDNVAFNEQAQRKIDIYTSDKVVEVMKESSINTNFISRIVNVYQTTLVLVLAFLILLRQDKLSEQANLFLKFAITLSLVGVVTSFVPSMGRFVNVGILLILIGSIVALINDLSILSSSRLFFSRLALLATILIVASQVWIIFTFSFHTLFGNYFTVILDDSDILYSVGDLLFYIFK
jgi:hypothetical protein